MTLTNEPTSLSPARQRFDARVAELAGSREYRIYLQVRDAILNMMAGAAASDSATTKPSAYWEEELAGFEYMLDASPLIVHKLRHQSYHLTGINTYEYRTNKTRQKDLVIEKLGALKEIAAPGLLVPESRMLGGFGHSIDGALYNVDTIKFYEVLIALDRGGVLGAFRNSSERRIAWEIGAGWGGFSYAFKTLFPNTTYVIVDLPATMLYSGVYLQAAFPEAKSYFHEGRGPIPAHVWTDCDFVFIPHYCLADLTPPHLDLAINMVSFQEMTTGQVEGYVAKAAELGAPYLYSLNRDRSAYNTELTSVPDIIEKYFWPHVIPVLDVTYTQSLSKARPEGKKKKGKGKRPQSGDKAVSDYAHIIGWRRVAT